MKKQIFSLIFSLMLIFSSCVKQPDYDIIVYGGTSAGVIAAYSADKEGKKVLLIEPGKHLGGLTSSGLGSTDIGNKHAVTGLARDFYRRLGNHYNKLESWYFEPHVAEKVFLDYINESDIEVLYNQRLNNVNVKRKRIRSLNLEKSSDPGSDLTNVSAYYFIDCSYEGDLMAMAGVSYTVGRESNETYGETYNGVQLRKYHQFPDGIDPYIVPGDPSSGLCWGIQDREKEPDGTGDSLVQAYNYRLCLSKDTANQIAFTPPENYDPSHFELLKRVLKYKEDNNIQHHLSDYMIVSGMPNQKTDINNRGAMSTDAIGMNWDYPEAGYAEREKIAKEVEDYTKGFVYFLSHDNAVPDHIKENISQYGWAADEFRDNDYFPHQMYVREARRMVSDYVMTEHNCTGDSTVDDGIGLAAYTMDSHNCQRIVVNGMVKNEGNVEVGDFPPYEISYRSLVPRYSECVNLSVPVCLSASHIAFGSIRMEPVFMVLGQVCGYASTMALDKKTAIQDIKVNDLVNRLQADPYQDGTPPDIVIDNSDSKYLEISGEWSPRISWMGQYKSDHLIWKPGSEPASVSFRPEFDEKPAPYHAYLYIPRKKWVGEEFSQLADDVKIEIKSENTLSVGKYNFQASRSDWVDLGAYSFVKDNYIKIIAKDNQYPVTVDALLLVPEKD